MNNNMIELSPVIFTFLFSACLIVGMILGYKFGVDYERERWQRAAFAINRKGASEGWHGKILMDFGHTFHSLVNPAPTVYAMHVPPAKSEAGINFGYRCLCCGETLVCEKCKRGHR